MKRIILICVFIVFIHSQKLSFQTSMLLNLYKNENKNICISPLSIYQIVSLVSNGASGKTQDEILKALLPDSIINKKSQFKLNDINNKIVQLYNSKNKYVKIANAVMTKQKLKSVFLKMCKKYDAFVEPLTSASQVNKWCSEKTNGKINHIIDSINGIEMMLLNAVYFKSDWKSKFDAEDTGLKDFKNSNGETVKVKTMYKEYGSINYYGDDKIQIIELPYEDNHLSMVIILPNKNNYNSPLNFMKNEKNDVTKMLNKLKRTYDVRLYLPKFKYEYQSSLVDAFKKMNMKKAFTNSAEFTKLNEGISLKINDIIHKTFIAVDEKGTEAAAVTGIKEGVGALPKKKIYTYMYVDHSFIYMIKDNRVKDSNGNDLMLFFGVVNNLK